MLGNSLSLRRPWTRRQSVRGRALVVLAMVVSVAVFPAAASAAPGTLYRHSFQSTTRIEGQTVEATCSADGRTISYQITGVVRPNGYATGGAGYTGTFQETGTVTLGGPASAESLIHPLNIAAYSVTSLEASWTVTAGDTTITGTRALVDPSLFDAEGFTNVGTCVTVNGARHLFESCTVGYGCDYRGETRQFGATTSWEATIDGPGGQHSERGFAGMGMQRFSGTYDYYNYDSQPFFVDNETREDGSFRASVAGSSIGTAPGPELWVATSDSDFGIVEVDASAYRAYILYSAGSADVIIDDISLVGANAAEFAFRHVGCAGQNEFQPGARVTPGQYCYVQVSFTPSSAGAKAAALRVTSNVPDSPHTITLTGTGSGDLDAASGSAPAGGTVATGDGGVATMDDPITTAVTTPTAGTVTIAETPVSAEAPSGYSFVGQNVSIEAPAGTVDAPLRLTFRLEWRAVSADHDHTTIAIFRDGVQLAECTTPGAGRAAPDPCVDERRLATDGDIVITALSSHASLWQLAVAKPYQFGGFLAPVDAAPTSNKAKAGSAIPVKFSLGADWGLRIFASGYPRFERTTCSSGTVDAIEQTVTSSSSSLTYDAVANRYSYTWKTRSDWAGTCGKLVLRFADGSQREALFDFRK